MKMALEHEASSDLPGTGMERSEPIVSNNGAIGLGNGVETGHVALLPENMANEFVQLFKLLSDETRLQILHILRQRKEVNVLTLCQLLNLRQPSVSHHLALLRVHHLIDMRRSGKHNFYRIQPNRIVDLLRVFSEPLVNSR